MIYLNYACSGWEKSFKDCSMADDGHLDLNYMEEMEVAFRCINRRKVTGKVNNELVFVVTPYNQLSPPPHPRQIRFAEVTYSGNS